MPDCFSTHNAGRGARLFPDGEKAEGSINIIAIGSSIVSELVTSSASAINTFTRARAGYEKAHALHFRREPSFRDSLEFDPFHRGPSRSHRRGVRTKLVSYPVRSLKLSESRQPPSCQSERTGALPSTDLKGVT